MFKYKKKLVLIILVVIVSSPLMTTNNTSIVVDQTSDLSPEVSTEYDARVPEAPQDSPESDSKVQRVYSLDGSVLDTIPDFVYEDSEVDSIIHSQSPYIVADVDPNKPNITAFRYQNMTAGDGGNVTWMQPGETVRVWFEAKGPLSDSGHEVRFRFDGIVDESTDWDYTPLIDAQINNLVTFGVNDSVWFYTTLVLPSDTGSNYGWGNGLINAFTMSLYQPYIFLVQDFEEFFGGLYEKSSYLHMFGEVYIKGMNWYNYTYDSSSLEFIPATVAERNWEVFVEYEYWVINAPVWGIGFKSYYWREIVWWPDESILISDDNMIPTKLEPGTYTYRPQNGISWTGWLLEEDWVYGSLIGQTPWLYTKLNFYSAGAWAQIYDSKEAGEYLHLVENILEQPPQVEIINPMDGEVIDQSATTLRAMISDPNSNRQITELMLYIDDVETSIFSEYDPITGLVELDIDIPVDSGAINITLQATDSTDLMGSSTTFIISDNPMNYFPSSYTSSFENHMKSLSSQVFAWEYPLTFNAGTDLNISLTPRVEFGFDLSLSFDIYYSSPSETYAGEEFTTYVSVSDPAIDFTVWLTIGIDYDIMALNSHMVGSFNLIDESWSATRNIPLGIDILDLRYDIPGISDAIRKYTHYKIAFLDCFPVIGDFANLDLLIDIIPLFKMSNLLTATLSGTNCDPDKDSIEFVSDKMFALTATVDADASGSTAEILLNDILLESSVGLDLWTNFTLNGGILGYSLVTIDMNQWLYDYLGISVPHLCLWNSKLSLPVASEMALRIDVAEQQLDVGMTQIFADENTIDVTVYVEDEWDNGISSATVEATINSVACTITEGSNGQYVIEIPYQKDEFDLEVTVTKSGYLETSETFTLYIDPITVDSTPPSIASINISPDEPTSSDLVTVSASISDDLTEVSNPILHYSIDNGNHWVKVNMSYVSGTNYEATIPSQPQDTQILYFISVSDEAGNNVSSAQQSYTVAGTDTTTTPTDTTTDDTTDTLTTTDPITTPEDMMELILISIGLGGTIIVGVVLVIIKKKA